MIGARQSSIQNTEQHAVEREWLFWMLNSVADPVILTDAQHDIVLQNTRAEALFKVNAGDTESRRHAVSTNNALFAAELSRCDLGLGAGHQPELRLIEPSDGTELIFELVCLRATNSFNGRRGSVAVLKNITDVRRATAEEIRLERDRLNLILRSVPNPIVLMDVDNQPILMNPEALRLFQGTAAHELVCSDNAERFRGFVALLRQAPEQGMRGELVLHDPDTREPLSLSVTATEVRDEHGGFAATVSVLQDVSRLRELERRRIEQTLFDSEKLAATGRLAASIAHEINNPLEAIKNSLYLLTNKTPTSDPNFKFLQIATKETERVSRILRQMLGFYRPPKMEQADLNRLIEDSEGLIDKHLRQNRVRVHNDLEPGLPQVIASPDQIRQVVLNLLLNAQQAMPDGGTIWVTTRSSSGAEPEFLMSDSVHIQVRDSGLGIPEDVLPHIFEPFFSTKDEKGTGLGLWVSQGIVQAHGGSIKLRSRQGRGATFSVTLPIGGPEAHAESR